MEVSDSSGGAGTAKPNLPPGFRFHPTDEELVVHYLKNKITSSPLPVAIIAEVDLYKFDPWELPAKATFGEQEWYFFSPRDRKYPNGARPNRAATSGYWKATGTDKPILSSSNGNEKVGVKKALVFYGGKPPKGVKSNWIMHEYRLVDNKNNSRPPGCDLGNKKNSLRLDDWVLCRIYKKHSMTRPLDQLDKDDAMDAMLGTIPPSMQIGSLHYSKTLLLENNHNFLEGIPSMTQLDSTSSSKLDNQQQHQHHQIPMMVHPSNNNTSSSSQFMMKRSAPSLYWMDEDDHQGVGPSTKKGGGGGQGDNASIVVSSLNQLPQTTSLHQQTMLGSVGDGIFGQPYQLSGFNWYN